MTTPHDPLAWAALAGAVAILAYLVYTLLRPERF